MTNWKRIDAERFEDMRDILPPAIMTADGFLIGEPYMHRECAVTGAPDRAAFIAFVEARRGGTVEYFESLSAMTVAEFRALNPADVTA